MRFSPSGRIGAALFAVLTASMCTSYPSPLEQTVGSRTRNYFTTQPKARECGKPHSRGSRQALQRQLWQLKYLCQELEADPPLSTLSTGVNDGVVRVNVGCYTFHLHPGEEV